MRTYHFFCLHFYWSFFRLRFVFWLWISKHKVKKSGFFSNLLLISLILLILSHSLKFRWEIGLTFILWIFLRFIWLNLMRFRIWLFCSLLLNLFHQFLNLFRFSILTLFVYFQLSILIHFCDQLFEETI
jgi:hypothetical protein